MKTKKHIKTFEDHKSELKISDINDSNVLLICGDINTIL